MQNNSDDTRSDRELALWMLEQMGESEEFLGVLRAARRRGARDVLDTPDYAALHQGRLAKLFQGEEDENPPVEVPSALGGVIEEIIARDLLSGREEFMEKALRAYLDAHPRGAEGLPEVWATTLDAARDEIAGRTQGAFEPGFVSNLAAAAREELALEADRTASRNRDGRDR